MAATTTIGIRESTKRKVAELARREDRSIDAVRAETNARYEAHNFGNAHNRGYQRLRLGRAAWAEHERQLAIDDGTFLDGLDEA